MIGRQHKEWKDFGAGYSHMAEKSQEDAISPLVPSDLQGQGTEMN